MTPNIAGEDGFDCWRTNSDNTDVDLNPVERNVREARMAKGDKWAYIDQICDPAIIQVMSTTVLKLKSVVIRTKEAMQTLQ